MSTERLNLPEVLARPRDHAIICTFGADLDFYEGPLWRSIARARNRLVLADDGMLARKLSDLASGGSRLRHININYVAAPITNPGSAHAKLILLVDGAGGTLLVGSGNVGIDGYASRGEVFCRYDIAGDSAEHLPEFQAAKQLLDGMLDRGYVDEQSGRHLKAAWSDTPWIWGTAGVRRSVVRHNLTTPLSDQLVEAVGGEPVLELVAHAPFHDAECVALRRLLTALAPDQLTVLVQPGRTSVDPAALETVLAAQAGVAEVQIAAVPEFTETYLHAKFVLVRTETRSIVLTGSANLSLAALYRTDRAEAGRPSGNIELVNLLEGPPESFDELLAGLELSEVITSVGDLDVRYLGDADEGDEEEPQPRLLSGTWSDGQLVLMAAGELPEGDVTLVIAGTTAPASITVVGSIITVQPSSEGVAVLDARAVPVWLRIATSDGEVETTPVYPYHRSQLDRLLTNRRDEDLLKRSGDLDMESHDEDLTALLDELDAALVIDRHSLWRLARRSPPPEVGDGDGARRAWEDLDFDALRRHPKLAQYNSAGPRPDRVDATDLQIILAAITDHFRGIGEEAGDGATTDAGTTQAQTEGALDVDLDDLLAELPGDRDDVPTDETPEEFESDDDAAASEQRRLKIETRNRLAWQRFCDRFTKALQDPEFLDLVGPQVALANSIIFNHLLALLVAKGIVDGDKGVGYQLQLWTFLSGDEAGTGFLDDLDEDSQIAALEEMAERGVEAVILSAVDYASQLTHRHGVSSELRRSLRHVWQRLLETPLLHFGEDVLRRCARPGVRNASDIASGLDALAREWSEHELLEAVAACLGTTTIHLARRTGKVARKGQTALLEYVEITDPGVRADAEDCSKAFATIHSLDPERGYIRFEHPASRVVAVWDLEASDCWWWDHTGEPVDIPEPSVDEPSWSLQSRRLIAAANKADQLAA